MISNIFKYLLSACQTNNMSKKRKGASPFLRQCFVTGAVCCSILGHGCYVGFPAILLPQLYQPGSPIPITSSQGSWFSSIMAVAMLAGNFVTPAVMARLGRRAAHAAVSLPALVGWFATTLAEDFEVLVVGRLLTGLSFGMLLPLRSALIGEYTSPKNRGAFLSTVALAQAAGIFLIHLGGAVLGWRLAALLSAFLPFTSLVMTLYSPESPSFLATRRRYQECREAFHWLRGYEEEDELEELITARQAFDKQEKMNTIFQDFKKKEFYKPLILVIHCQGIMQFAGGATMGNYSTIILGLLLGADANVNFWMVFLDGQRVVFNTIAVYFINRIKRRTMMFSASIMCILCHVAISVYLYGKHYGFVNTGTWLPTLLINLQMFTVAVGMVPVPNVIAGEVFALQFRSIGSVIGIFSASVFTFGTLKSFPTLISGIGLRGTYALYAVFLTYFMCVIWYLLPETKGKTLQQIEDEFRGRPLAVEEAEERSLTINKRKMSVMSNASIVVEV